MSWFKTDFKSAKAILAYRSSHIQINGHIVAPRLHIASFDRSLLLVKYVDGTSDLADEEFADGIVKELERQRSYYGRK